MSGSAPPEDSSSEKGQRQPEKPQYSLVNSLLQLSKSEVGDAFKLCVFQKKVFEHQIMSGDCREKVKVSSTQKHLWVGMMDLSGFELIFQKCIVKIFCRKIGGDGATTPRLGHLRKIGVTCAKNTRNIRGHTRNIHKEYAYDTQG